MTNNIKIGLGAFLVILILFFINQRLQSEHSIKPGKIFDGNIDVISKIQITEKDKVLELIKNDLKLMGISHDNFFSETEMVNKDLVNKAVKKLKELKSEESSNDSFLRMGVKPGGCSGFSYEMFFDTDKFDGDVIEEYDGVNIVVDGQSLEHVKGATLDYKEGLMDSGFSIDNPNVSRTCGCGNSFS